MSKASGVKGDTFERDVSKFLNQAYGIKMFARSPGSGAYVGRSNYFKKQGLSESAVHTMICDIITPDDFPYVIECKHYADKPAYATLIKGPESTLDKWLSEVELDASRAEKLPMLFFRTNNKGTHIAIPKEGINLEKLPYYVIYREYVIFGILYFDNIKDDLWQLTEAHLTPSDYKYK